jgi:hypothetical protein
MSSPAPFYRYSSITTPGSAAPHERSSPPSSGAIDLAETLVEFSSPIKPRREFSRPPPSDLEDSPPLRNGVRSSLGDLQGVDLLRGFEKISSWREGGSSSPVKPDYSGEIRDNAEFVRHDVGFGRELKVTGLNEVASYVVHNHDHDHVGVNGNGPGSDGGAASQNGTAHTEEEMVDSQMTEVR